MTFRVEVTTVEPYKVLEGKAFGELEGTGKWVFESKENTTFVTYFWNVRTNKFWMRNMDFLLRPLFKWNHDIVMNWGYEGLRKKL